jgi:hypothetical protein
VSTEISIEQAGLPILREVGVELQRLMREHEQAAPSPSTAGAARAGHRKAGRGMRLPAIVAALVIAAAGCGAVASGLLTGAPDDLTVPDQASSGTGISLASGVSLAVAAADPVSGLPWALRTIKTSRGLECFQVGRLQNGQIGILGTDGAFNGDGRFHPIPTAPEPISCAVLDAGGNAFAAFASSDVPASAELDGPPCVTEPSGSALCPNSDERALFYGTLGPEAKSVTYLAGSTVRTVGTGAYVTLPTIGRVEKTTNVVTGGRLRTVPTVGPQGAYLIVLRARGDQGFAALGPPSRASTANTTTLPIGTAQPIRRITYRNGVTCTITATADRSSRGGACTLVGLKAAAPPPPAAALRSPVRVVTHRDALVAKSPPLRENVAVVTFTARVAVTSARSAYDVEVVGPCRGPHYSRQLDTQDFVDPNDVAAGQTVSETLDLQNLVCPAVAPGARYSGRVLYWPRVGLTASSLVDPALSPDSDAIPAITVARFSFSFSR